MKLLSKFALLLFLAGLVAILFSFMGVGPRVARLNFKAPFTAGTDPAISAAPSKAAPATMSANNTASDLPETANNSHVRIPAISGESYYGWVQLPRGTSVELIQQRPDTLIVRWEGITVKVPLNAASTGAIALRQAPRLAARN